MNEKIDAEQDAIVASARALLEGGEWPSADLVAAAAGVSRSTYYRRVGSHRELLRRAGVQPGPATRERIIEAAIAVFAESGLSGFSMEAVAARAGVGRATVYRTFANRGELLAATARTATPLAVLGPILARSGETPPAEFLPNLFRLVMPRLLASRSLLRAILSESAFEGEGSPARQVVFDTYRELAGYIQRQMEAGRLRPMDPLTAVQGLLGPILFYALVQPSAWASAGADASAPEDVAAALVDVWLRGMEPEPAP
jgi:TetR/AcrR family transcriptional regulator, regulator of autoinduction and epiphytic fitness